MIRAIICTIPAGYRVMAAAVPLSLFTR